MKIGSILDKMKSLGGKGLDLAGRGALYSQVFGSGSNQSLTMGQRIGGALTSAVLDNTLGQMGTLGGALRGGLESRGTKQSPTGGGGVPGSTIPYAPIKTDNVIQAIGQSTQQLLSALNTLNATLRLGLNATANQMQAQASGITSLKIDTQDMVISLREIYDLLNKQDYESSNKGTASNMMGVTPVGTDTITKQTEGGIIQDLLTGALLTVGPSLISRIMPMLGASIVPAIGGALTHFFDTDTTKAGNSTVGSWINENIPGAASVDDFMYRMSGGFMGTDINDPRYSWNQKGGATSSETPAYNPNKSRAEATKQNTGKELTSAEIDSVFKAAPENISDEGLLALAQRMFPGRKYNTLKNRMKQLHMLMQPGSQSSLGGNINLASTDTGILPSGEYLVNRQKMLESQKTPTEEKLRAKEQQYEESIKNILDLIKYEAREVLFNADNIRFDASKIEFTEGGGAGAGGGFGGGAGSYNGAGGGYDSGDSGEGADATKVPQLSAETTAAAIELQSKNVFKVAPGTNDPLGQYSDEQLRSQNIVSHTNTDGTKVYTYAPGGIGGHADKIGGSGATSPTSSSGQGSAATKMFESIMTAETGSQGGALDPDRFIRTRVRARDNPMGGYQQSSAYGPVQMTKSYLEDFKYGGNKKGGKTSADYNAMSDQEKQYLDSLIEQGQTMLKKGESDPVFGAGGKGTLGETEEQRKLYASIAQRTMVRLARNSPNYETFVKSFRGGHESAYFKKIAAAAAAQGTTPEQLFAQMKTMTPEQAGSFGTGGQAPNLVAGLSGITPAGNNTASAPSPPTPAPIPLAATPAQLDPSSVQSSQKVAELSKKTTMNREAAVAQGPVTQNVINNNRQEADTTGTGYPSKDMPLPGFTPTMDKHLDMLWT